MLLAASTVNRKLIFPFAVRWFKSLNRKFVWCFFFPLSFTFHTVFYPSVAVWLALKLIEACSFCYFVRLPSKLWCFCEHFVYFRLYSCFEYILNALIKNLRICLNFVLSNFIFRCDFFFYSSLINIVSLIRFRYFFRSFYFSFIFPFFPSLSWAA